MVIRNGFTILLFLCKVLGSLEKWVHDLHCEGAFEEIRNVNCWWDLYSSLVVPQTASWTSR
jgi:hypothetical protein